MQRIGQAKGCLDPHAPVVPAGRLGVAVPVSDPLRKILSGILRIKRLHRDGKPGLIHGVHQIAQHLFRTAAGKGLDKKENIDHFMLLPL